MALAKGTTYDNVWFDVVLKTLKRKLKDEIPAAKLYISPLLLYPDNYQIKIWGSQAETHDHGLDYWNKVYTTDISFYTIEKNQTELFYEQFYSDIEKIYQTLHKYTSVEATSSSNTFRLLNGVVEEILINEFDEVEEQIDGLAMAKLTHTCLVERAQ